MFGKGPLVLELDESPSVLDKGPSALCRAKYFQALIFYSLFSAGCALRSMGKSFSFCVKKKESCHLARWRKFPQPSRRGVEWAKPLGVRRQP
jgi:hypothetical protein